jgi:multidrug resistance efflux pump
LPPSEASLREAQANLADQEDQVRRARQLYGSRAIGQEELTRREQAYRVAKEQVARAQANYDLLKAGAWEQDKAVSRAKVAQARAQVQQSRTELQRLEVKALGDGEVLDVKVHPGEFVGTPPGQTLLMLGNVRKLHVRVDVDEHDIPRFRPGAPANAVLRGNTKVNYPLTFVRVEPYVLPKKSLTGDNTERVDTRVLQVIYAIDTPNAPVYVGQQLDVFIDAAR